MMPSLPEAAIQTAQSDGKSVSAGGFEAVLERADNLLKAADKLSAEYAAGRADLTQAAVTAERADISLGFLMALRRQAVQAYQQIMNMPI